MAYYYSLRIETDQLNYKLVSDILKLSIKDYSLGWIHETKLEEDNQNVISEYLEKIENSLNKLEKLRISKDDISIWLIYEYNNQCNLEFPPEILKQLGVNGIKFCLSCYEQ